MANSIRSELRRIVLLTSAVAVVGSCAVFMAYQWTSSRSELRLRQSTLASIVADQAAAALEFDQPEPLAAILKSLKGEPTVDAAVAYTRGNRLFAQYVKPGQSVPEPLDRPGSDGQRFVGGELVTFRPVESAGERVGTLAIWSNLSELTDRALLSALTALGVLAMAGAAVVLLSGRLESRVTGPVLRLGRVAREVADKRDYSVRLVPGGLGETDH